MISTTSNDLHMLTPSAPNKRKLSEERDDDVIVTPSSFYESDSDDSARDTNAFVSTPSPSLSLPCESPTKRLRPSKAALDHSQLSPPLMPRFKYRHSTIKEENRRTHYHLPGRLVLDLFSSETEQPVSYNDLSFLAIPTPPSRTSEVDASKIPTFGLSPRTTMAPSFPPLLDSRRLFACTTSDEKENSYRRRSLPSLRMRPQRPQLGKSHLIQELSLPPLVDATFKESRQETTVIA